MTSSYAEGYKAGLTTAADPRTIGTCVNAGLGDVPGFSDGYYCGRLVDKSFAEGMFAGLTHTTKTGKFYAAYVTAFTVGLTAGKRDRADGVYSRDDDSASVAECKRMVLDSWMEMRGSAM